MSDNEVSNLIYNFGNGAYERFISETRNGHPQINLSVRETLHEEIKQPGNIRDRVVCYCGESADKIFNALIFPPARKYTANDIELQRRIVFCDPAGYYDFKEKHNRPGWDTIIQGIDESPSPFGDGRSHREKDGGYYTNLVQISRNDEREINEITMKRITPLTRNIVPIELHALFAELQKMKVGFGILLTETLPLAYVGSGQIYVKSLLARLGEIQRLFYSATNEDAIRRHFVALNSTLSVINAIADKEDLR